MGRGALTETVTDVVGLQVLLSPWAGVLLLLQPDVQAGIDLTALSLITPTVGVQTYFVLNLPAAFQHDGFQGQKDALGLDLILWSEVKTR